VGTYNDVEFPTALAYRATYGCGGEEEFAGEAPASHFFRGCEWKRSHLPVLTRTIGKETDAALLRLPVFPSKKAASQHSAFSQERLLPGTGRTQRWPGAEC
jgi:hypothetical protein